MSKITPFIVGITGASGSGKTSLIRQVCDEFKEHELCLVSQDNYYKPQDQQQKDENNVINFDNLPGITGIFGRNARGKSSIIGTIAYSLFNTSDRGSIKNLHIVNTRHNRCKAELDISINNVPYRIIRDTKKRQTKN